MRALSGTHDVLNVALYLASGCAHLQCRLNAIERSTTYTLGLVMRAGHIQIIKGMCYMLAQIVGALGFRIKPLSASAGVQLQQACAAHIQCSAQLPKALFLLSASAAQIEYSASHHLCDCLLVQALSLHPC